MHEEITMTTITGDVKAYKLSIGEKVEPTDFYLSTSGRWQLAPISGHVVIDNGVEWARLAHYVTTDRRGAIAAQKAKKNG